MNIRSQVVTANGITIVASNGAVFTLTNGQIRAFFVAAAGNLSARRASTIQWVKDGMLSQFGAAQFNPTLFTFNFVDATGSPSAASWGA
jgi:hypothetical protein